MYYILENIINTDVYKQFFDYNNLNNYINLISNDIKYTENKLIDKLNNFINLIKTSNDVNYLYVDSNLLDFENLKNKMYENINQNYEKYIKYDNIFVISYNNSTLNLYKIEINKLIKISSVIYYNFELNFIKLVEYYIKECNNVYINHHDNNKNSIGTNTHHDLNNINDNVNDNISNFNNFNITQTQDNITNKNYNINDDVNLKQRLLTELKQTIITRSLSKYNKKNI